MDKVPLALFLYNRPKSTQKVLLSLVNNTSLKDTICFAFIDGPRNTLDILLQTEILNTLFFYKKYFYNLIIVKSEINNGLGTSIINGVNYVFSKFDSIIVLEDDLVVHENFLDYNNLMLNKFKDTDVFHISSWTPVSFNGDTVYKTNMMHCWGWSTWKEKWNYFDKNPIKALEYLNNNPSLIYKFNFNNDLIGQLYANNNNLINSWAIFWHFSIFINNGICINPTKSLINNIGLTEGTNYQKFDIRNRLYTKKIINYRNFNLSSLDTLKNQNNHLRFFYKFKNHLFLKIFNKIYNFVWKM